MSSITVTIPTAQDARVAEALCAQIGITGAGITGPNAKLGLLALVRAAVTTYETNKAAQAAAIAAAPVDLT